MTFKIIFFILIGLLTLNTSDFGEGKALTKENNTAANEINSTEKKTVITEVPTSEVTPTLTPESAKSPTPKAIPIPEISSNSSYIPSNINTHPIKDINEETESKTIAYNINIKWSNAQKFIDSREAATSAGNDSYIYTGFGSYDPTLFGLKSSAKYYTHNNTWVRISDAPDNRSMPRSSYVNGSWYVFGGASWTGTSWKAHNNTWRYNDEYNNWTELTPIPIEVWEPIIGVINGKVYLTLGRNETATRVWNKTYVYDVALDSWSTSDDFPGTLRGENHGSAIINGTMYFGGGWSGSSAIRDWWGFNPSNESGTQWYHYGTPSWTERYPGTIAASIDKAYVIGGYDGFGLNLNEVWEFSPDKNTWIQMGSHPDGRIRDMNGFSDGINIHMVTGIIGNTGIDHHSIATYSDNTPPDSVTQLLNISYAQDYINWTWIDPQDLDFAKVMVYLDGVYKNDVLKGVQYYNATGLSPATYTIGTRTVDTNGNINDTMVTRTATTIPPTVRFINGTIMDSTTRAGIAGVKVFTNTSITTNTDESGKYSFLVLSGTYKLTATSEPKFYPNSSVTVVSEMNVLQDIELIKKPTGNINGSVTNV